MKKMRTMYAGSKFSQLVHSHMQSFALIFVMPIERALKRLECTKTKCVTSAKTAEFRKADEWAQKPAKNSDVMLSLCLCLSWCVSSTDQYHHPL